MRFPVPKQRAVFGGLLISIAAGLAFIAAASGGSGPASTIVISRHTIAPGTRLTSADIETTTTEISDQLALNGFDSVDALLGAGTLAPIGAGELIQRSAVRVSAAGADAGFSFPIAREHALDGDLRPGDTVDVLATFGTGIDAETAVLARSIRLSAIGASDGSSVEGSGRLIITAAAASTDLLLDIAHAAQVAELTLVRTTGAQPSSGGRSLVTGPRPGLLDQGSPNIAGVLP